MDRLSTKVPHQSHLLHQIISDKLDEINKLHSKWHIVTTNSTKLSKGALGLRA